MVRLMIFPLPSKISGLASARGLVWCGLRVGLSHFLIERRGGSLSVEVLVKHALRQCRSRLIFQYSIICNAHWAPQNYPNIPKLYIKVLPNFTQTALILVSPDAIHHSKLHSFWNNSFLRIPGNAARYPVGTRSLQWMKAHVPWKGKPWLEYMARMNWMNERVFLTEHGKPSSVLHAGVWIEYSASAT